jgi:hypothetical protein
MILCITKISTLVSTVTMYLNYGTNIQLLKGLVITPENTGTTRKEPNSRVSKEISHLLWNLKVHYHAHKSLPQNQTILAHPAPICKPSFCNIHLTLFCHLCKSFSSGVLPSGFLNFVFLISRVHATHHVHLSSN